MSQSDCQDAPGPAGGWRRLGPPDAVALAGLIAAGGHQFFYAKKNYAYLVQRDHRVLATRAKQIGKAGHRQAERLLKGSNKQALLSFLYVLHAELRAAMIRTISSIRRAAISVPPWKEGRGCAVHTG